MKSIGVLNQKGGVGKSTVAICLAVEAMQRGLGVLLVDADPQGTARTWAEVASENGRPVPMVIHMGATMHKPGQLPELAQGYALVVIDGPPRHGDIQRSMLMFADTIIIPCGPSANDAWALGETIALIVDAQTLRPELEAAILINRRKTGTAIGAGARDALGGAGLPVLKTEIADRVAYQEALAAGQGVTTYAPGDAAAQEIKALYREIMRG